MEGYLALIKEQREENDELKQRLDKIKNYLKQVHMETKNGILSSNSLIWENIKRLCDGKDILENEKR